MWQQHEILLLKRYFPTLGAHGLSDRLPGRTVCAIKRMANRLRLKGPRGFPWTADEDRILIDNYQSRGAEYVSERTGRSVYAVWHRADHLRDQMPAKQPTKNVVPSKKKPLTPRNDPRVIGLLGGRPCKYTIQDLHAHAQARGGRCLSTDYLGWRKAKHKWECYQGHTWENTWEVTRAGVWCKTCKKKYKRVGKIQRNLNN